MIKVSVATICLNSVDSIERTILSVLGQDYQNIEYIIIDGESDDGTLSIIDRYKDDIDYIVSQSDKGIYDAYNKAISIASGDYMIMVNSDDFLQAGIIQEVANILESKDVDLLHGNVNWIRGDRTESVFKPKTSKRRQFWRGMGYYHPTFFVKTEVYRKLMFDTKYQLLSDYKFLLEFIDNDFSVFYYDKVITNFSSGGASSNTFQRLREGHDIRIEKGESIVFIWMSSTLRASKAFISGLLNIFRRYP